MTGAVAENPASSAAPAARTAGLAIAAAVVVLFAFYGAYFAQTLVPLTPEQMVLSAAAAPRGVYDSLLTLWQAVAGPSLLAARVLSLLASVLTIVLAFGIARRVTGDVVMAAFLLLPFVLFPPLVAALSTATPHALFVLSAIIVMALLQRGTGTVSAAAAGLVALAGGLLHPVALVTMPLWVVLCAAVLGQRRRAFIVLGFALAALVLALAGVPVPTLDPDVSGAGHGTILKALAVPYAMIIVATVLSAVAALSGPVRAALNPL
ncbi:MAG: hypothetical protein JNK21_14850, partial [Rhodospirillaceae bacterium]|nr:hypothetical protein [Rhodospirillaceae bacterium]